MGTGTLILINFSILILVLIVIIYLIVKVKTVENKSLDISARDIATFVEQMREMVVESERAAYMLDNSIKDKEASLEDLTDLVSLRIAEFEKIVSNLDRSVLTDRTLMEDEIRMQIESEIRAKFMREQEHFYLKKAEQEKIYQDNFIQQQMDFEKTERERLNREYEEKLHKELMKRARTQKDIKPITQPISHEPIIAGMPRMISQPIVKSTEEVLRTRTEPMLVKQVEDRIPVDAFARIIKQNENTRGLRDEEMLRTVYSLLFNGLSEKEVSAKLKISEQELERLLSLDRSQ